MMVADNEVDTLFLRIRNLLDGFDTTIENDNKFHTCFLRIVYSLNADTIALFLAVGDIVVYVRIELLQKLVHQCHRSTPVDIVVAIHHDTLFASHRIIQAVYRYIHVVHQERVNQFVHHRSEESFGC